MEVIALDENTNQAVGFITAISDGVLSPYIPFLEVLPEYKSKGIGKELVKLMLKELDDIYMVDLCCDDDLVPYYEKFGMLKSNSMLVRNYEMQSGMSDK
nr:GNAT family N-acetyltransferase [Priestia megaterium]